MKILNSVHLEFCTSLNPRNATTCPCLTDVVKHFDYEHMNSIIKLVTSYRNNIKIDADRGKSDLLYFLKSHITIEDIKKAIQNARKQQVYLSRIL